MRDNQHQLHRVRQFQLPVVGDERQQQSPTLGYHQEAFDAKTFSTTTDIASHTMGLLR
jgi:hypothetical protein